MNIDDSKYQSALSLMLKLGFLASYSKSNKDLAVTILTAYKVAKPTSRKYLIGEALMWAMAEDNPEEAVKVFRDADLKFESEDSLIIAFFAFFLIHSGHNDEARKVVEYVLKNVDADKDARKFANAIKEQLL